MAISIVGVASNNTANATDVTVTLPVGTESGCLSEGHGFDPHRHREQCDQCTGLEVVWKTTRLLSGRSGFESQWANEM